MLISVIIPCYNQEKFLDETLSSVFKQSYSNWECIIVDDGSTDDSGIIAKNWLEKDRRFLYFKQENAGVSAARNFGLSVAKGAWIQFLDGDDYLTPSKLTESIKIFENNTSVNFIVTHFRHFTKDVQETTDPFCTLQKEYLTFEKMLYAWNDTFSLPIHTVLVKKELIGDTLFPVGLTAQEDWLFWVAILKKNCVSYFINKPLVLYRTHTESRINSKGIIQDQLMVHGLFKQLLTQKEHFHLSEVLIERYLNKTTILNRQILSIKNSNIYQSGMMLKKILKTVGLLKPGRKLFHYIRTFKKSSN